jgi:hypothetical protein
VSETLTSTNRLGHTLGMSLTRAVAILVAAPLLVTGLAACSQ